MPTFPLLPNRTRYAAPASPEEQKIGTKLSKYAATTNLTNGLATTTTLLGSAQSQIESRRQLGSSTGHICPTIQQPAEVDDADPDVIPNQYGGSAHSHSGHNESSKLGIFLFCTHSTDGRPSQLPSPMPLFSRSPVVLDHQQNHVASGSTNGIRSIHQTTITMRGPVVTASPSQSTIRSSEYHYPPEIVTKSNQIPESII